MHVCVWYRAVSCGGRDALVLPNFVGPIVVDCLDRPGVLADCVLPSPLTLELYGYVVHVVGSVVVCGLCVKSYVVDMSELQDMVRRSLVTSDAIYTILESRGR